MRILVVILIAFTACTEIDFDPFIDLRAKPYIDEFYIQAANRNVNLQPQNTINVSIARLHGEFGVTFKDRYITIDKEFFESYEYYSPEVEVVVFHELGHALLKRDHCESPSIMQMSPCINCYKDNEQLRKQYLDELFKLHR